MRTPSTELLPRIGCVALALLLIAGLPAQAEDDGNNLEGNVELLYRNVSQGGSTNKFNEDFDGLESGARLANMFVNWTAEDSKIVDYVRVNATGLGGDPYERADLRLGQKDAYEFSVSNMRQTYLYNLFELVPDEDGASWDTERQMSKIKLTLYPTEKIRVFFDYRRGERTGNSLFMKDIQRNLFRLETPLDQTSQTYGAGATFEVGSVDILFKQEYRRYDNNFVNMTENDTGLSDGLASLDMYEWNQRERGETDLTTLTVSAPLGRRVRITASAYGTLLGDETLTSNVDVNAEGTSFDGTCSVSAVTCSSDADCALAGDVCVANPYVVTDGFSMANLEGDSTLIDLDLSAELAKPLTLIVRYRTLDRDLQGNAIRDLDGDGVIEDPDGDGTPGTMTTMDYEVDTIDALLEYRPTRKASLRGGYRVIDRSLTRDGFGGTRDIDFESDSDGTIIFGFTLRPVGWFKFDADYEDANIDVPFNAPSAFESEHTRIRAAFKPGDNLRIDLTYLDYTNDNTGADIRDPGSFYNASADGSNYAVAVWHRPIQWIDYNLRYAMQDQDTNVRVTFDQAGFFAVEDGNSIFDNENTQLLAHVNIRSPGPWSGFVRYVMTESDGTDSLIGDINGPVASVPIDQEFHDIEGGATYTFNSGVFIGASIRDFDYDDINNLLDYNGTIFTIRGGTTF